MTSILVSESSGKATSQVRKNESCAYDRFQRIDELVRRDGDAVRLCSRKALDWTAQLPAIAAGASVSDTRVWQFAVLARPVRSISASSLLYFSGSASAASTLASALASAGCLRDLVEGVALAQV
jgi:hypothetical protein